MTYPKQELLPADPVRNLQNPARGCARVCRMDPNYAAWTRQAGIASKRTPLTPPTSMPPARAATNFGVFTMHEVTFLCCGVPSLGDLRAMTLIRSYRQRIGCPKSANLPQHSVHASHAVQGVGVSPSF